MTNRLNGIDISNWQKGIDLSVVPCDFVIMKATEGTQYISPDFQRQYQQAKEQGKLLGIYHYANGKDAVAEADFFLKTIKSYVKEAILCLDWEAQGNSTWNTNKEKAWIKTWLERVEKATGVKPLIYIQASALNRVKNIGDYGLWVAQYANNKRTGYQARPWNEGKYTCAIRQYASTGRLEGYNGNLDLDIAYMDSEAWKKYANPGEKTTNPLDNYTNEQLAQMVIDGRFENGESRKKVLGARYEAVQKLVNSKVNKQVNKQVVYYTVKKGDTLSRIASKYNTTYQNIAKINGIENPNFIQVGQKLRVK